MLCNTDEDEARRPRYLDLFAEQRVRGVLITPVGDVGPRLERLRSHGIPSVLVDRLGADRRVLVRVGRRRRRRQDGGAAPARDGQRGASLFVGGPSDLAPGARPHRGRRGGRRRRPPMRRSSDGGRLAHMLDGVSAGRRILRAAGAARRRLRRQRPRRPRRAPGGRDPAAASGCRRTSRSSATTTSTSRRPPPSRSPPSRQPRARIGAEALDLLLAEIDGNDVHRRIVFQPELVTRESTRAARS